MSQYTIEGIAAQLDQIFGRDPVQPTPSLAPAVEIKTPEKPFSYVAPPEQPLFIDNPTPQQAVSSFSRITAYAGEDKFLEGMIKYSQQKAREAAKKQAEREKQRKRR